MGEQPFALLLFPWYHLSDHLFWGATARRSAPRKGAARCPKVSILGKRKSSNTCGLAAWRAVTLHLSVKSAEQSA